MRPLVSAVVPAYNSAATLARALQSIKEQDYEAIEIIVVDDGSADGTADVVRECCAEARVVELRPNCGASRARNAGVRAATGEYIAFLDADDRWLPAKIARQVELIHLRPQVALVSCDAVFRDETGVAYKRSHEQNVPTDGSQAWRALLANNFIPTPTVLCRRCDLLAVGGFDPLLPVGEDLDLWIRLALRGEVVLVREVLVEVFEQRTSLGRRFRASEPEIVMDLIERHIHDRKADLAGSEVRRILGRRYFKFGANAYAARSYRASVRPFLMSAVNGVRPLRSVLNALRSASLAATSTEKAAAALVDIEEPVVPGKAE